MKPIEGEITVKVYVWRVILLICYALEELPCLASFMGKDLVRGISGERSLNFLTELVHLSCMLEAILNLCCAVFSN